MQYIFVTYPSVAEPPRKLLSGRRKRAILIAGITVKPLFGRGKNAAIDVAGQFPRGPAWPVPRQQRRRQQGIAQNDAAVLVDQQDARGKGFDVGELVARHPASQRLKALHEAAIGLRGALERPAFAEQPPS